MSKSDENATTARVEDAPARSTSWLDGWCCHKRVGAPINPYNPASQEQSHWEWQQGYDERESRRVSGTLLMAPNYDELVRK